MPSNETAKTKSAPKSASRIWVYVGLSLAALALLLGVFWPYGIPTTTLTVGQQKVTLQIASTNAEHVKGLSDRKTMAADQGMLFSYTKMQTLCFWMKSMYFPLDMVWLNAKQQVVYIRSDVGVNTYPKSYCAPAQYVVELKAGEAAVLRLKPGMQLHF